MFLVDTSSWVSLARYFLPFDNTSLLKNVLSKKLEVKEIMIIDKVFHECMGVSQRIVVSSLPFLKDFSSPTVDYVAQPWFHNLLVNHLCNANYKLLPPEEKEVKKEEYLNGADCRLVLVGMENRDVKPVIVTEESRSDNDGKFFKKLPVVCDHEKINLIAITLTDMLQDFDEIDFSFIKPPHR